MDKRTILALVLAGVIIILYPYYLRMVAPPQPVLSGSVDSGQIEPARISPPIAEDKPIVTSASFAPEKPTAKPVEEKETIINTEKYVVVLTNIGGAIKKIYLKEFKDELGEPILLLETQDPEEGLFNITSPELSLAARAVYSVKKSNNEVVYTFEKPGDFVISKKYIFHKDKYGIELELVVDNLASQSREVTLAIVGASRLSEDGLGNSRFRFKEVASMLDGNIKRENIGHIGKGKVVISGQIAWSNMRNKYFSLIFKPYDNPSRVFYNSLSDDGLLLGAELDLQLEPRRSLTKQFILYAGPTRLEDLKALNLEETLNFGKLDWIAKILLKSLKFFYKVVKNYGVAIILLTILMYFLMYPLTIKSLKTMKQMQLLQPQMVRLKEEYKDNPQKLNKEIMEMYRTHKVNPFSGCLPLLLQMPVFISLYNVLSRSIELKGAHFLWIKDLSMPDALFKLPFSLPFLGNLFNLLPILMLVAMMIQQKLSAPKGAPRDEQQKMMALMMPIMFGFIFYNLPSGLVLYWLTNTIFMVLNQELVLKKMHAGEVKT